MPWIDIVGQTARTLNLGLALPEMNNQRVRNLYTNTEGSAYTDAALITVTYAPMIIQQPIDVVVGSGGTVMFAVDAYGSPSISYQWREYVAGVPTPVPGETKNVFRLDDIGVGDDSRRFDCLITNSIGGIATDEVEITVLLQITKHPEPVSVVAGQPFTLEMDAEGPGTVEFRWQRWVE